MIRAFAWWGISRSTSSVVWPFFSRTSRQAAAISTTARLKTSRPLGIWMRWRCAATVSGVAGSREPPPGMMRISAAVPSAPSTVPSIPGRSAAWTIAAPAPSPNSTQVCRSWKSRIRLNTSAPISSTVSAMPAWTNPVAVAKRVGEPGAGGVHIEGRARQPELLLDPHGGRRGRACRPSRSRTRSGRPVRRRCRRSRGRSLTPRRRDRRSRRRRRRSGGPRCPCARGSTRPTCPPCPRTTCSERGGEEGRSRRP